MWLMIEIAVVGMLGAWLIWAFIEFGSSGHGTEHTPTEDELVKLEHWANTCCHCGGATWPPVSKPKPHDTAHQAKRAPAVREWGLVVIGAIALLGFVLSITDLLEIY